MTYYLALKEKGSDCSVNKKIWKLESLVHESVLNCLNMIDISVDCVSVFKELKVLPLLDISDGVTYIQDLLFQILVSSNNSYYLLLFLCISNTDGATVGMAFSALLSGVSSGSLESWI